jgi:hypothetical protein
MSLVTNIASGQQVKSGASTTLRGIAFGGDSGVARVSYSIDRGQSWREAQLGKDEGRYGFRQWQTQLTAGFMRNVVETVDMTAV